LLLVLLVDMASITDDKEEFRTRYLGYNIVISREGASWSSNVHPGTPDLTILASMTSVSFSSSSGALAQAEKRIDRLLAI